MASHLREVLQVGKFVYLPIEASGQLAIHDESTLEVHWSGEAIMEVSELGPDQARVRIQRLDMSTPGEQPTGEVSVLSVGGEGVIDLTAGQLVEFEIVTEVYYDALEENNSWREIDHEGWQVESENFGGTFRGTLNSREVGPEAILRINGEMILGSAVPKRGLLHNLRALFRNAELEILPPGTVHPRFRVLPLRPVRFRNNPQDPQPTGTTWQRQLQQARKIWSKCCIDFLPLPFATIDDPSLKHSTNISRIRMAFRDPGAIEVFFVDSDFGSGGSTSAGGRRQARVVISDRNLGNPNLLAHELGHVLSGLHPGPDPPGSLWAGEQRTIMVPTGTTRTGNPERNTLRNCRGARNPLALPVATSCVLMPDP